MDPVVSNVPLVPTFERAIADARRASRWRFYVDMARHRLDGPPVRPEDGIEWLAATLVDRILDKWDAVVMWTGDERSSKSTGVMRTIQAVERKLEAIGRPVPFVFNNLCYGARPLNDAYRQALHSRETARQFWYDEGGRGILAGETFDPEQRVITRLLQQAGVANAILYIAIPDPWTLAKKVRGRRAVFWADTVSRGTERRPAASHADFFERDRRRHFEPTSNLGFARSLRCPEITYEPYAPDDPFWMRYEAHKFRNLDTLFDENDAILDSAEAKMGLGRGKFEGKFIRLTKVDADYLVENRKDERLGRVAWFEQWRKYVFTPEAETVYDTVCAKEISAFLNSLGRDRPTPAQPVP